MSKFDSLGRTVLFDLIIDGNIDEVKKYQLINEEVNLQDNGGKSPLHFACIYSQFDIANFLLQSKAEVDVKDNNGNTPLFDAVFNSKGEESIIKLLLSHGANPDIKNNYEVSPKSLADTIANFDVSHLFVK